MATLTVNVTLGNDSVSNAQLENMAEGTIKGRADGAGTGDPTDLTPDQASTILDAATDPFVRTSAYSPGITDGSALSIGLQFPNAGLTIADQNADHTLVIVPDENFTADRQLSIEVNDANRTIDLAGDLTVSANATVSGTNTGDQDLSGLMVKASNLSDVSNTGTARDNLGIITRKVSTATTGVGASYTDVTDLSFGVVAGTTYHINVWILAECSNTGGGVCLSANGPAFTYFAARYEGNQTAGGSIIRSDVTAYDSLGSLAEANSVSAANTPYIFQLQAVLVPSANGTFVARVKRGGGAGNVAVRAGMIVAHAM